MKTKLDVVNADSIEMSMTITMTLEHWKKLRAELTHKWPACDLKSNIDNLVSQAEKHFYPEQKDTE